MSPDEIAGRLAALADAYKEPFDLHGGLERLADGLRRQREDLREARRVDDLVDLVEAGCDVYEIGEIAEEQGDLARAERCFRRAADVDHDDAAYRLATVLERRATRLTQVDAGAHESRRLIDEAAQWYERAWVAGVAQSAIALGHLYQKKGDQLQADSWLEKAAEDSLTAEVAVRGREDNTSFSLGETGGQTQARSLRTSPGVRIVIVDRIPGSDVSSVLRIWGDRIFKPGDPPLKLGRDTNPAVGGGEDQGVSAVALELAWVEGGTCIQLTCLNRAGIRRVKWGGRVPSDTETDCTHKYRHDALLAINVQGEMNDHWVLLKGEAADRRPRQRLTERQVDCLRAIFPDALRWPPIRRPQRVRVRAVAEKLGISETAVRAHLLAVVATGGEFAPDPLISSNEEYSAVDPEIVHWAAKNGFLTPTEEDFRELQVALSVYRKPRARLNVSSQGTRSGLW